MWPRVAFVILGVVVARSATASPLRDEISALACGDDAARARALEVLDRAPRGVLGLPDEGLTEPATEVHAYVIDRLLEVLGAVRVASPELAPRVDALVASWNYCALTAEAQAWDVRLQGPTVERTQRSYPSSTAGRGFGAWGLIPRRGAGRPSAPLAADPDASCDVALRSETPSGSLAAAHVVVGTDETCEPPRGPALTTELVEVDIPGAPWLRPRAPRVRADEHGEVEVSSGIPALHAAGVSSTAFVRQSFAGKLDSGAQVSWAPWTNTFVRLGATWQLARDFAPDARQRPSWSAGLGYDDWHPGTWSFQVNQWGPVDPGDGWTIVSSAVAELGYKVRLPARLGARLGLKLALSSKLTWAPSAGASVSVKLPGALFVSLGIVESLTRGGRPSWTYVLGRATWRPGTLSVIVANFGPNPVPHANFVAHTAVTVSGNWSW